ncbi:DUF2971 domain-containing protein [Vibrio furnissii]|uniref:DUF2971 domain-containing protein n=1 Tax=Vibrio furnissii TaxID=29494 RepID=UPI001302C66E|nr:DUF2971 domain-containing protein [Vibrio furnissii]
MESLYKYCPVYNFENLENEYAIQNVLNNQVTFSKRTNFNDLFDSKIDFIIPTKSELRAVHAQLKGAEKHEFKQLFFGEAGQRNFEAFRRNVNQKFDEYLFFCLTDKPDNNLMWSHYANSHKGFCLEWNVKDINAEKVIYQDSIAHFELLDVFKMQFGLLDNGEVGRKIWEALKIKLREWEYESEYRVQFGSDMKPLINKQEPNYTLVSYKPEWITAIIFGCRMDKRAIAYLDEKLPAFIERRYAVERKSSIEIVVKN